MPLVGSSRPHPRLVIFDLDRALIDARPAFTYTVEEAVAAVTGRRLSAAPLADEYHARPWRDALRILLDTPADCDRAEELCREYAARSALKRLLVHEGVGMALDTLRAAQVEMAAFSRRPYPLARKHVESTGLDRFFAFLAAPASDRFELAAALTECLRLLEAPAGETAVIAPGRYERTIAARLGAIPFTAAWVPDHDPGDLPIPTTGHILEALHRRWEGRPLEP
ncbi:HAD family hydrolase [Tepidiforma sp.]|uniref:HAD family hydrolase n=1 Tax=Tepidiforma sp. TaxID=2682230 RepID=UPI002ADDE904|nr:HAD hydrolase-like protein [Tepidiforma sp.]